MSDPDYRAQARAVRAAARQRLRELSQRRGAEVPRWQTAAQAATAPPPPEPTPSAEPVAPQATVVTARTVATFVAQPLPAEAEPPGEAEWEADGHDLSVMTVSMAASAVAQRAAQDPAPSPPVSPAPDLAAAPSDLGQLPGVGPGLVWLLREAGVSDCAALSSANTAQLSDRLGLVGRLVDIEGLQALAAARHHGR